MFVFKSKGFKFGESVEIRNIEPYFTDSISRMYITSACLL